MPSPFERTDGMDSQSAPQRRVPDFIRPPLRVLRSALPLEDAQGSLNSLPSMRDVPPTQPEDAETILRRMNGELDRQQRKKPQQRARQAGKKIDFIRATSPATARETKIGIDNRKVPRVKTGEGTSLVRNSANRRNNKLTVRMLRTAVAAILEKKEPSYETGNGWKFKPIYAQKEDTEQNEQDDN